MLLDKDERYYHPLQQDGDGEQSLATPPFQGRNYKGYAIVSTILLILSMSMNIKFIVAEFLSTSSNNNHTAYGWFFLSFLGVGGACFTLCCIAYLFP